MKDKKVYPEFMKDIMKHKFDSLQAIMDELVTGESHARMTFQERVERNEMTKEEYESTITRMHDLITVQLLRLAEEKASIYDFLCSSIFE